MWRKTHRESCREERRPARRQRCGRRGVGFEHDTNEVLILFADGDARHIPLTGKRAVAEAVLDAALDVRSARTDANHHGELT